MAKKTLTAIKITTIILIVIISATIIGVHNNNTSKVIFLVDGTEYCSTEVVSGSAINKLPEIPQKLGYHGSWSPIPDTINSVTVVNAVYEQYAYQVAIKSAHSELFETYTYETRDYTGKLLASNGISRDAITGQGTMDGTGQITIELVPIGEYVVDNIWISGNYGQIKTHFTDSDIKENCFRITKIASDIIVNYSIKPKTPSLSRCGGFYDEEFDLELTCLDNGTIYYTLDGSTPTPNSLVYETPIHIQDVSNNPNYYSRLLAYEESNVLVDKCMIVRAMCIDENGYQSDVVSQSYFIGFDSRTEYDRFNFVSIITDHANLFDSTSGIFTDENRLKRGIDWEREIAIQFFDDHRSLELSQQCGMRVHGGGSRSLLPFSLNLYARSDYGPDRFNADLFETGYISQHITLFSGGNDYRVRLIDKMVADFTNDYNVAQNTFKPYVLFLNGEFLGYYWLTEKYDNHFISYYYDTDNNNVVLIKNGTLEEGKETDINYFYEFWSLAHMDMSNNSLFQKFCDYVDLESLVDYYAIELFVGNGDGLFLNNCALWRTANHSIDDSDEKWHLMIFDLNMVVSFIYDGHFNTFDKTFFIDEAVEQDAILKTLMNNSTFKKMLYERILTLVDVFNTTTVEQYLDNYYEEFHSILCKEYERIYSTTLNGNDYLTDYIERTKAYYPMRAQIALDYITKDQ